jgi:hypothetical protein
MQESTTQQRYPAGTIISCPADDCSHGLYKTVESATFADLIVFDDIKLARLNDTISQRNVWEVLACPFCGARLLKDGKIHTLQYGWR